MSEWSSSVAQVGHHGRQLQHELLAPQLPPRTRQRQHRRLEVVDPLSPQNKVLQELCFIRPGLLRHLREPFIRITLQEQNARTASTVAVRAFVFEEISLLEI